MNTNTVTASNSHGVMAEEIVKLRALVKAQTAMLAKILGYWTGGDIPKGWDDEMAELIKRARIQLG